MTYSSTRQNLSIDVQGNNNGAKPGGVPIERIITVRNRGGEVANIDLWIRSNDAKSEPLLRWCTLAETDALANGSESRQFQQGQGFSGLRLPQVEPRSDREVILRFDVPPQAEPDFYSYDIVAQAPQYPGEQSKRTQQLRVLTFGQDVGLRSEPSWSVEPATSSDTPFSLPGGTTLQVKVTVTNRSDAVDRFYLSCPELNASWFDPPLYPEGDPDAPGLIARTDGLMLNPGESGEILVALHPPIYTPAGYYSSTLRLTSFNRTNLVLLDIIYLKIEVNDRVLINLQPPVQKIPNAVESFNLSLSNLGNIVRLLNIQIQDKDAIFTYGVPIDRVQLAPGESQAIELSLKPKKWWRRNWRGQEQEIIFDVRLLESPIPESDEVVYLPEAATGKIIWQSHPAWIAKLLKLLLILLLLAGAIGLAYWLVRELVVKPSEQPKILEFSTTEQSFQAGTRNPIRLDWKISNPQVNAQAIATFYSSEGSVLLNQSYPLQTLTSEQKTCENGTYQPNVMLRLIRRIYGRSPDINTVSCVGISAQPSGQAIAFRPGEYQVRLEVLPSSANAQNPRSYDSQRLSNIKLSPIPPLPLPEILYFYSKTPIYRQAGSANAIANPQPQYPNTPIQLNWVVNNIKEIAALELNSVHIAANGAIENRQTRYIVQNGIPAGIGGQCRIQGDRLLCENIPTQATAPGKYTFTLTVVLSPERGGNRITKDSESIEIRPPLPNIQTFTINGTDVLQNPQLVQMINPARGPVNLDLNWQVADSDQVKVELLPAPGIVTPATTSLSYTLSPTPGSTTLTLQVTNQAGEMVSRSVVIQTAAYPAPPAPVPVPPAAQSAPNAASAPATAPAGAAPGTPIAPDQPPPYELPPRAN